MIRQLTGDCRVALPTLEPASVQACITSPPYYGLRDYGLPPLVWSGDAEHAHGFEDLGTRTKGGVGQNKALKGNRAESLAAIDGQQIVQLGRMCLCGAWLGSLGLEPTPDAYIEHIVEVFRHVRRVLRDDGVLWLNLGDSYAGSGKWPSNSLQSEASQLSKQTTNNGSLHSVNTGLVPSGLKPKDLMMMPFRVAMALQADGWYLRSVIPWLKRNSMPESVTDRPATSVEYVFLLAKSARYYWDADAANVTARLNTHSRGNGVGQKNGTIAVGQGIRNNEDFTGRINGHVSGRNRRNSDWFFESWRGLLLDEHDDPLALVVNPAPFTGAHFATFPAKLVEPMIRASTRRGDTILDPFGGAGTVGLVSDRLDRNAVLIDLNPDYAEMTRARLTGDAPMFVEMVAD